MLKFKQRIHNLGTGHAEATEFDPMLFWFCAIYILDKILVFPGFVLAIIARNVARLAKNSDDEERKRALEIISLGLSVIAVLLMLWLLGDEMFDPFTSWF